MRALFEQTLKYFLINNNKYEKLKNQNNGRTPTLEKMIETTKKDHSNLFNKKANLSRCFKTFADSTGTKDYFDMVIHNPQLVKADFNIILSIANAGLRGFIQSVLNEEA